MPAVLSRPIRVLLADDHRLLREGVRRGLHDAGLEVVAEAANGQEAVQLAERWRPDVVLMDISMPILDGIGATRALLRQYPEMTVIVLTMFTDPDTLARVEAAGAAGWLGKDCTTTQIAGAVRAATNGELDVAGNHEAHPRLAGGPDPAAPVRGPHTLTAREIEVLSLVAQGASSAQLAARLYISPRTVKNHLASIYDKLGARDRTQALVQAARLGIVDLR